MTTAEIIQEFTTLVNADQDYTLPELKKILGEVYKTKVDGKPAKKVPAKKVPAKKAAKVVDGDEEPSDDDKPKKKGRPAKVKLDKDGNIKEKKAPSAYNIFVKSQYAPLKEANPEATAPEIMKLAAALWKTAERKDQMLLF